MEKVDQKIEWLKANRKFNHVEQTLRNKKSRTELSRLQRDFVITPIDKATGNVAFICKRFYATVLLEKLGLNKQNLNPTYLGNIDCPKEDVVHNNTKDLKSLFNLCVTTENQVLPHIYWIPKMYKKPIKFRFIIAAPKCSIKPLSKAVTSVFKLFFQQIESYNRKSYFYSGIKTFWVIQNNEPVLNSVNKINARKRAKCISSFDFSTMKTKIPHNKLLEELNELIDFSFQGGSNKYVAVIPYGAKWVPNPSKFPVTFDKVKFKNAIKYLMDYCFFTPGEKHCFYITMKGNG